MAMSVVITDSVHRGLTMVKFAWTSHVSAGTATGTSTRRYTGEVVGLATDPGVQPTDNYDITITDEDSLDVLAGQGANRHETTTQYVTAKENLGIVVHSKLTLNVSAAGNSKAGIAYLFLRAPSRW